MSMVLNLVTVYCTFEIKNAIFLSLLQLVIHSHKVCLDLVTFVGQKMSQRNSMQYQSESFRLAQSRLV